MAMVKDSAENVALKEFQSLTSDLNLDNVTLLRFLRAREYNLDKAEDMLRKSLQWRAENEIHKYVTWTPPQFLHDDLVIRCTGTDFEGHPVFWVPVGRWMYRKWVEEGHQEDLVKMRYHLLEAFMTEIDRSEKSQMIGILGLEELTYWKIANVETMQLLHEAFRDMEQNYPEIMKAFIVVNAPRLFKIVFNIVKPILSAHTMSKLSVHNSDKSKWLPELRKIMPENSIPKEYLSST